MRPAPSFRPGTTVTAVGADGSVTLTGPDGETRCRPERILFATGIRETPRAARLVSGDRPLNVLTTGALLRLVAAGGPLPFARPVVVGSELVAFSAALTLREHGARPVAMVEEVAAHLRPPAGRPRGRGWSSVSPSSPGSGSPPFAPAPTTPRACAR